MDFEVTITVLLQTPHSRIFKKFLDVKISAGATSLKGSWGNRKCPCQTFCQTQNFLSHNLAYETQNAYHYVAYAKNIRVLKWNPNNNLLPLYAPLSEFLSSISSAFYTIHSGLSNKELCYFNHPQKLMVEVRTCKLKFCVIKFILKLLARIYYELFESQFRVVNKFNFFRLLNRFSIFFWMKYTVHNSFDRTESASILMVEQLLFQGSLYLARLLKNICTYLDLLNS